MKRIFLLAGSLGLVALAAQTASAEPTSVSNLMSTAKQDSIGQVTSVSQLSDVQPTDWAFQALQSLVERYGCIAGYPDGTFRGNRAATRYELAAALNACLDQISDRFASKEDLATVKALQEEFKTELATLKGRVDGLEARTKTLEAQQFSTTTKLQGEALFAVQYGDTVNTRKSVPNINTNSRATALARVRLNFNTSFTGSDLLQTQLEVGNGGQDLFSQNSASVAGRVRGQSGFDAFDGGVIDYAGVGSTVALRRLAYSFKPTKGLTITIGPKLFASDFIDFNSYANNTAQDFSSGFFANNTLIIPNGIDNPGGAGAAFDWKIGNSPFSVRGTYVAASPTNSVGNGLGGGGLFGDPYQGSVELEYARPFGKDKRNNFAVRLQYTHSEIFEDISSFRSNKAPNLGGAASVRSNVVGVNAEATFGRFGVFGRFGYSFNPDILGVGPGAEPDHVLTWAGGLGVRDIFVPGSLLAVGVGQPFVVSKQSGPEQTNFEGFYRFPINDNITITPAVQFITDVNNRRTDGVIQGLVRATFSF